MSDTGTPRTILSASGTVLSSPVHASSVDYVGVPCTPDGSAVFRMRIIEMDHYMSAPIHTLDPTYSPYSNHPIQLVPVHRLYGTTPAGQKCCLHIHNYLPYLYTPLPYDIQANDIDRFLIALGSSIVIACRELAARNKAETLKPTYVNNTNNNNDDVNIDTVEFDSQQDDSNMNNANVYVNDHDTTKSRETIYSIVLVYAKSVFGYMPDHQRFIKITLLNPAHVKSVAAILQSGCILQQVFQPYESHIPYNLQFLADHNLYGMDFIDLQHITFRRPLPAIPAFNTYNVSTATENHVTTQSSHTTSPPNNSIDCSAGRVWTSSSTPIHMIASITQKRHTYCEIECDGLAEHILNKSIIHTQSLTQTDPHTKLVQSLAQIWDMEKSRRSRLRDINGNHCESSSKLDDLTLTSSESSSRQSRELDTIEQNWRNVFNKFADDDATLANNQQVNTTQSQPHHPIAMNSTPSQVPLHLLMTPMTQASKLSKRFSQAESDQLADVDINKLIESQTPHHTSPQHQRHHTQLQPPEFISDSDSDELTSDERQQFNEKLELMASQAEHKRDTAIDTGDSSSMIEYNDSVDHNDSMIGNDHSRDSVPQLDGADDSDNNSDEDSILPTQVIDPNELLVYGDTLPETQSSTPPITPVTQSTQHRNELVDQTQLSHTSMIVQYDNDELDQSNDIMYNTSDYHLQLSDIVHQVDNDTFKRVNDYCYEYNLSAPSIDELQLSSMDKLHQKPYFSVYSHYEQYTQQTSTFASVTSNFYPMKLQPPLQCSDAHTLYISPFIQHQINNKSNTVPSHHRCDINDISIQFTIIGSNQRTNSAGNSSPVIEYTTSSYAYVLQPILLPPHPFTIRTQLKQTRDKRGRASAHTNDSEADNIPIDESYGLQRLVDMIPSASQLFDDNSTDTYSAYNTTQHQNNTPTKIQLPDADNTPERIPSPKYNETFNMEVSYFLPTQLNYIPSSTPSAHTDITTINNSSPVDAIRRLTFESQLVEPPDQSTINSHASSHYNTHQQQNLLNQDDKPLDSVDNKDTDYNLHMSDNQQQHLTIMTLEIHTCCRSNYLPDPLYDPISAIIYHIKFLIHGSASTFDDITGILLLPQLPLHNHQSTNQLSQPSANSHDTRQLPPIGLPAHIRVDSYSSEQSMLNGFVRLVRQYDPDILCGYEIQKQSLGYMVERCGVLKRHLCEELSRVIPVKSTMQRSRNDPAAIYAQTHSSGITIHGRVVLNLWRIFRDELKLNIYTYENVVLNVLNERHYHVTPHVLSQWFISTIRLWQLVNDQSLPSINSALMPNTPNKATKAQPIDRHTHAGTGLYRCLMYHIQRAVTSYRLLDTLDVIGRTSELARVFGIKFFNVLDRGSQYRVESMVLRLSKPQSYLLCSLSPTQRAQQPAMECLPLVMEPISRLYTDPVVVLDFQSLYPSMMIAYNMCYTTTLGKVPTNTIYPHITQLDDSHVIHSIGGWQYTRKHGILNSLRDHVWISPNGVMFVQPAIRQGIVPRMLSEILDTRVMVKNTMKRSEVRGDRNLHRILNARQFGLKLIANVTYGYTAAGYSGRMPCAELADAIVQTARHTLERAMYTVESNQQWNAKVLYGDTDSLFVLLAGRSKSEAFDIGREICDRVTADNPAPIRLQMEKVYLPCMLVSKKRYVGYKYESVTQHNPILDAKGIELVRRDGCNLLVEMMDKMIHILFSTRDMSLVRSYLERQWYNIYQHRLSLDQFIFAKEVRLGTYKQLPLAAIVATRAMQHDRRAEPVYAMRVPYVIGM